MSASLAQTRENILYRLLYFGLILKVEIMISKALVIAVFANCIQLAYSEPSNYSSAASVLGQGNFSTSNVPDPPTARSLSQPEGIAIDPNTGKFFVADEGNNRVLRYSSAAAYQTNAAAEAVFGQADFVSKGIGTTATTMSSPYGITIDSSGRLWVCDYGNNRVLRFDNASTKATGAAADGVLGQPDFESATPPGAPPHSSFDAPGGVVVDGEGRLYVSDEELDRILRFDNAASLSGVVPADVVLGQPDLSTFAEETDQSSFTDPWGVWIDEFGNLWVCDEGNNRVLRFDSVSSKGNGAAADAVFGQDDFDSSSPGLDGSSFGSPYYAAVAPNGTLWVGDYDNNRFLGFRNAANRGADGVTVMTSPEADIVVGQPNFTDNTSLPASARDTKRGSAIAFGRLGSIFFNDYGNDRILRFSAPLEIKAPRRVKTRRNRVTIRGRSSGAELVEYRIPGQGGYKRAKGNTSRWRVKVKRIKRRNTIVRLRARAFDNRTDKAKTKVIKES